MAVQKFTSEGMDGNLPVAGVTFFSDVNGSYKGDNNWNAVLGVGVNETTREVTHRLEWAEDHPSDRKEKGQETIGLMSGSGVAAVELKQPIHAEDFAKIADVSRDLRTALGKFSKGLDTGAQTPGQGASR